MPHRPARLVRTHLDAFDAWLSEQGYALTSRVQYQRALNALLNTAGWPPRTDMLLVYIEGQQPGWQSTIRCAWRLWSLWVQAAHPAQLESWAPVIDRTVSTAHWPHEVGEALCTLVDAGWPIRHIPTTPWVIASRGQLLAASGTLHTRPVPAAVRAALHTLAQWATGGADEPDTWPMVPTESGGRIPASLTMVTSAVRDARRRIALARVHDANRVNEATVRAQAAATAAALEPGPVEPRVATIPPGAGFSDAGFSGFDVSALQDALEETP